MDDNQNFEKFFIFNLEHSRFYHHNHWQAVCVLFRDNDHSIHPKIVGKELVVD